MRIVAARPEHLVAVAAIYADAARTSTSTFDLEPPPLRYWRDKVEGAGVGDHLLVAVAESDVGSDDGAGVAAAESDDVVAVVTPAGAKADADADADANAGCDVVRGFAYSGWFRTRPAYAGTRETSIYLPGDARGEGLGRRLYTELLRRLREDGIHLAVAVIAQPNPPSVALHEALGFELVGTFAEIGHKFGRYVDTRWYQLRLSD